MSVSGTYSFVSQYSDVMCSWATNSGSEQSFHSFSGHFLSWSFCIFLRHSPFPLAGWPSPRTFTFSRPSLELFRRYFPALLDCQAFVSEQGWSLTSFKISAEGIQGSMKDWDNQLVMHGTSRHCAGFCVYRRARTPHSWCEGALPLGSIYLRSLVISALNCSITWRVL